MKRKPKSRPAKPAKAAKPSKAAKAAKPVKPASSAPPVIDQLLELKNPHSVRAVLSVRPKDVTELRFYAEPKGLWNKIAEMADEANIPIRTLPPPADKKGRAPVKQERTGHAVAFVKPRQPVSLQSLLKMPDADESQSAPLWLALDSLQDPHNVGAIFRSAAFFGVRGILMTRSQSAPINATVHDIAAGGVEHVPFAIEANLNRALKLAKDAGLWILGTSEHAEGSVWEVDRRRPWLTVVGNEQKGLRRLTLEKCDHLCTIPGPGDVGSLNVSVATGIVLAALQQPF
ncbi:23S rRNA (guanosine(2251)-2'-O)-methyltransferase RlmB [Rubinisphaera margarita]|uniref:23S rRNA (guanosine(2251)-2'-O)-methyltransferase RlmB n=1 Tax=Rubinisphaera margarita TaxID=2909586 RepID=UPI001EE7BB58|nr:23S rRNA (guanosine(2251)-2'-O)-methyltransferase RlmB [Rubinisphaera margarita]MCG6158477.1 23S rRNA (guanosine(2251)-2'-O)-methyltransferase RlmB [Rubinisphaera margarita]